MMQTLLQQTKNQGSYHRDIRLAMRALIYRARGHQREILQDHERPSPEAEGSDDDNDDTEEANGEMEGWWTRDASEAAFDGRSLVEHHDRLAGEVREGFRQQARNVRWLAAHGPGFALPDADETVARLFAVAQANALTLADPSSLRPIGQGLYASAALLNHSCLPNANWSVDGEGRLCVRAVRPIEAGEEVTVAYVDPTLPYHARQQALQDHFFFACRCLQCRPPPLALRDHFVADELMVMVKCPNTMDDDRSGSDNDDADDQHEQQREENVSICGHGMVTIAVRPTSGDTNDECEGRLECVECGYELPGDYARSVEALVSERALARLTRRGEAADAGDTTETAETEYAGLVEAIEEGMGLLHPCHQSLRTMVEHLHFAAHARGDALMQVYAAQTLVHTFHAYLRHPRLHLHVALLHLLSGHALISASTIGTTPTSSSSSSSSSPLHQLHHQSSAASWSSDESPLRLGVPSVFAARLGAERENWPAIGTEYLRTARRHLRLLLGRRHWLPLAAGRCLKGQCHRQQPASASACALVQAYI